MTDNAERRVTSVDVAREAGLSRTTVSFVLNNTAHQKIPDDTRKRVLDAAARLGYAPSAAARALLDRPGRCGCLPAPGLADGITVGSLLEHLSAFFEAGGLTFVVHPHVHTTQPLSQVWSRITPAAVLAFEEFTPEDREGMPAAALRSPWPCSTTATGSPRASASPISDAGTPASRTARRRRAPAPRGTPIPMTTACGTSPNPASTESGRPARPRPRRTPAGTRFAHRRQRRRSHPSWLAADPPMTAVCAYNDEVALAVLAGLHRLGLSAPQDLAVIGVDDIPAAALSQPPLTTVTRDMSALAKYIAETVQRRLTKKSSPRSPKLRRRTRRTGNDVAADAWTTQSFPPPTRVRRSTTRVRRRQAADSGVSARAAPGIGSDMAPRRTRRRSRSVPVRHGPGVDGVAVHDHVGGLDGLPVRIHSC